MNMLVDVLPREVEIDALKYPINTDFRVSILFEELMQDDEIPQNEKLDLAIKLYYKHKPHDKAKAVDKLLWFYRCGKEIDRKSNKGDEGITTTNIYSYEHDDEYIYSAFLEQYSIDLQDIEELHWWKFKAMFKSLRECKFVEIMGYRSMIIDSKMPKSQQTFYKRMKKLYRLPDNRTEEQREKAIADSFASLF